MQAKLESCIPREYLRVKEKTTINPFLHSKRAMSEELLNEELLDAIGISA